MPIGRFLCVMVPLLAASIWLVGSWMEPSTSGRPTATKAATATTTTTVGRASEPGSVRSSAALAAEPSAAGSQALGREPRPTMADSGSTGSDLAAAADLAMQPAQAVPKQGSKKRQVQRSQNKPHASVRPPNYQVQFYNSAYAGTRDPSQAGYRPPF